MTNKELIKQEIKRRIENILKEYQKSDNPQFTLIGKINSLEELLSFIDSLPEEPASGDLEEEIDRFEEWLNSYNQSDYSTSYTLRDIARHFTEWQKQQMMKDAADSKITTDGNSIFPIIKYQLPLTYDCKIGDKVKLIIIKEEQQ